MNVVNHIKKGFVLFLIGGAIYSLIEFLFKTFISHGHTHWSMFIVGGIMFVAVGLINEFIPWGMPLLLQGVIGSAMITFVELISGIILNIHLQLNVWDYHHLPFNFMGQISLQFTIMWIFLAMVAVVLDDYIRYKLWGEEKPHYTLF